MSNKYSEASSRSLHDEFGLHSKKGNVAMVILEASVLVDVGIPTCVVCYQLEGDAPLIISAYLMFMNLEAKLHTEDSTEVRKILGTVIDLLNTSHLAHMFAWLH